MGVLTTKLTNAEIREILMGKGYQFSPIGHVHPDVCKLPEDYPWSFKFDKGPLRKSDSRIRTIGNYPLPCAFMQNEGLELINGNEPLVAKYHKEILGYLGIN